MNGADAEIEELHVIGGERRQHRSFDGVCLGAERSDNTNAAVTGPSEVAELAHDGIDLGPNNLMLTSTAHMNDVDGVVALVGGRGRGRDQPARVHARTEEP